MSLPLLLPLLTVLLIGCVFSPSNRLANPSADGVQVMQPTRFLGILSPYRVDIQQGNFVSMEMIAQIKPGMTADQVRYALGTPLLRDIFHTNRWDYPFRLQKKNGEITTSHVSIFFEKDVVTKIAGGDHLPTENEYIARISGKKYNHPNALSNTDMMMDHKTQRLEKLKDFMRDHHPGHRIHNCEIEPEKCGRPSPPQTPSTH